MGNSETITTELASSLALRRKSSSLRRRGLFGCSWVYGDDCDVVTELAKGSRQTPGAVLPNLGIGFAALFDESNPSYKIFQTTRQSR